MQLRTRSGILVNPWKPWGPFPRSIQPLSVSRSMRLRGKIATVRGCVSDGTEAHSTAQERCANHHCEKAGQCMVRPDAGIPVVFGGAVSSGNLGKSNMWVRQRRMKRPHIELCTVRIHWVRFPDVFCHTPGHSHIALPGQIHQRPGGGK
eukprot:gene24965-biopygen22459